jgi:hypothetical protein
MLDDIAYAVRWLTAFATGRGATALAVGGAMAAGVVLGDPLLPIIGLGLGIPVTAALATMSHDHQQRQLKANYREEIAAVLGIDARDVTMDHLRSVARGVPGRRIPGNRALYEALERNDRYRTISVIANIASAVVAGGLVWGLHSFGLPTVMSEWLSSAGIALGPGGVAEAIVMAGTATVTGLALDQVFGKAGRVMFGYDTPSLHEQIERLSVHVRRGHSMGVGQMMAMVAQANPSIDQEIHNRYGLYYRQLPPEHQRDVIDHYDAQFQLRATTEAINAGLMPAHELAFAVEGRSSGALPPAALLVSAYRSELEKAKAEGFNPTAQHPAGFIQRVPGIAQAQRFVDRVRGGHSHASEEGLTHVQRLDHQAALQADASKTLH